jgi:phototropin
MTKTMFDIHRNYISVNAPGQLNLGEHMLLKINKDLKATLTTTFPKLESIFTGPQQEIESIVSSDIYPRFVRHQLTMSATKALAGNRSKYAGLGDCFVLTNPAIADNPIVFASDGFVKVTGYTRTDIIPRNCRFLQGRHTDRQSVKRLRTAIDGREESVELLLNYKKNGEPFWNLLYTSKTHSPSFLT